MKDGNDEELLWREVLQRLTAIEMNTKGLDDVAKKANEAYALANTNKDDIAELKSDQKTNRAWLMGILATVIGYVIMNYILK
jgi:hypothetical protein|nr:MAG TPA: hemolysin [Caudoviricetes sp.]